MKECKTLQEQVYENTKDIERIKDIAQVGIKGDTGDVGPQGPKGDKGNGFIGCFSSVPSNSFGNDGDFCHVKQVDGDLWEYEKRSGVWRRWNKLNGPQGIQGQPGENDIAINEPGAEPDDVIRTIEYCGVVYGMPDPDAYSVDENENFVIIKDLLVPNGNAEIGGYLNVGDDIVLSKPTESKSGKVVFTNQYYTCPIYLNGYNFAIGDTGDHTLVVGHINPYNGTSTLGNSDNKWGTVYTNKISDGTHEATVEDIIASKAMYKHNVELTLSNQDIVYMEYISSRSTAIVLNDSSYSNESSKFTHSVTVEKSSDPFTHAYVKDFNKNALEYQSELSQVIASVVSLTDTVIQL